MIDGILRGFDCTSAGCFGIGTTGVVAGFSCSKVHGIHLRDSEYRVEIVDGKGNALPEGEEGEMVLSPVGAPELRGRPYEDFRARYLAELVRTQSMYAATRAVLGDEKSRDAFVAAWLAFWRTH